MFYRYIIFLLVQFALIFVADAQSFPKIAVKPFKIEQFELFDSFNAVGQIKFRQSRTYNANVEGRVASILNNEGKFDVKEGEVILRIDPEVAESAKKQKESAFEIARLNYQRNKTLFDKKFISAEKLEDSKVKMAEAEAALASAKLTYNDMIITAPFAGEIGVIKVRVGDFVKKGDYLFSLITKDEMSIFLEVPETLYSKISTSTEVMLSDASGNRTSGKIIATTPYLSDKGTISIEVTTSGKNKFLHGSYLNAEFIINRHMGPAIPERAILKNDKGNFIYQIGADNIIKQVYVQLGMRTNNMIEILPEQDIKEGDLIVLDGLTKVQEGAAVEVLE